MTINLHDVKGANVLRIDLSRLNITENDFEVEPVASANAHQVAKKGQSVLAVLRRNETNVDVTIQLRLKDPAKRSFSLNILGNTSTDDIVQYFVEVHDQYSDMNLKSKLSKEDFESAKRLKAELENEELTDKGYRKRLDAIVAKYGNFSTGRKLLHMPNEDESDSLEMSSKPNESNDIQARQHDSSYVSTHDLFAGSLVYTNNLYNKHYGVKQRKVIGHVPHLIDLDVIDHMRSVFGKQWEQTSSHRFRQENDLQFAFAYYHFLISERQMFDVDAIFSEFDTDRSGSWSDREIRTLLTRIHSLPLLSSDVQEFHDFIIHCHANLTIQDPNPNDYPPYERYYQSDLPSIVSAELVRGCKPLQTFLNAHLSSSRPAYPHVTFDLETSDSHIASFKTTRSSLLDLISITDDLRKNPTKFFCINDDSEEDANENDLKSIDTYLLDFFESMYPVPSRFELPPQYWNKFLHIRDFYDFWKFRKFLVVLFWSSLVLSIVLFVGHLYGYDVEQYFSDVVKRCVLIPVSLIRRPKRFNSKIKDEV